MYRINSLIQQIDFKTTRETLKKDLIFHHITFFHFHSPNNKSLVQKVWRKIGQRGNGVLPESLTREKSFPDRRRDDDDDNVGTKISDADQR